MGAVSSLGQGLASTSISSDESHGVARSVSRALDRWSSPLMKARPDTTTGGAGARPAPRSTGVRAIWPLASRGVNPPARAVDELLLRAGEAHKQPLASRVLTSLIGCFVASAGALTAPAAHAAADMDTPLTAWIEGVAESAQALADGDPARAEVASRDALAVRPRGEGGARAELALGLALRDAGRHPEAAAALARALPRLADPALAAEARFERAQALFYSGHPGAAAALFAEVAARERGQVAHRARWREADALLEAGAARLAV